METTNPQEGCTYGKFQHQSGFELTDQNHFFLNFDPTREAASFAVVVAPPAPAAAVLEEGDCLQRPMELGFSSGQAPREGGAVLCPGATAGLFWVALGTLAEGGSGPALPPGQALLASPSAKDVLGGGRAAGREEDKEKEEERPPALRAKLSRKRSASSISCLWRCLAASRSASSKARCLARSRDCTASCQPLTSSSTPTSSDEACQA
mmetsp:Transcript_94546/g.206952  ORF Transcript_94546/g.206952 Transcript_94546/m.206952 type:complete len:208 (+) Transcript_94546:17-640(+)